MYQTCELHGPSMLAVKAKIYGVLYKQFSSIAFDETSSYWSALNHTSRYESRKTICAVISLELPYNTFFSKILKNVKQISYPFKSGYPQPCANSTNTLPSSNHKCGSENSKFIFSSLPSGIM